MSLRIRVLAACVLAAALGGGLQSQALEDNPVRDFPSPDIGLRYPLMAGFQAKRARELLATQPTAPPTIRLLIDANRTDDALKAIARAVEGPVAGLIPVLEAVATGMYTFRRDDGKGHGEQLKAIIAPVSAAIAALPREEAARAAKALASINSTLEGGGSQRWLQQMREFVNTYAGTNAAERTAVELLARGNEPMANRLARLDEYWKTHPHTATGGYALYERGSLLRNVMTRGTDPTPMLLETAAIVKELESGRYPPGSWVSDAPGLLTNFFVSSSPPPPYAPGNIERSLEAYREFVFSHFDGDPKKSVSDSVGYVIADKMAKLYQRQGKERAGVEAFLKELESRSSNPAAVRMFQAQFYLRRYESQGAERAEVVKLAKTLLAGVAEERKGATSQLALAELAAYEFELREADAVGHLRSYIERYPTSEWAWVAGMRLGKLLEERGELAAAEAAYSSASKGRSHAFATVVGLTGAARTREGLGRFKDALDAYRQAHASWDTDFGIEYRWDTRATIPSGRTEFQSLVITREMLSDRAASIERALSGQGGEAIARASWLHREHRLGDARAAAESFLKAYPKSTVAAEGVRLLNEIKFDQALDLAAVTNASRNEAAALTLLDSFTDAPMDAGVFAGRMAKSTLLVRQGRRDEAGELLRKAMRDQIAAQKSQRATPLTGVDADVAAIRTLVLRPLGDLPVYHGQGWNAFTFSTALPEFVVVKSGVTVTLASGESRVRTVRHELPDLPQAVYLDEGDFERLARIVTTLGGTERREPTQVMETPNQPVGMSREVVAFWNTFFPSRAGHWGGWELATYPQVSRIEFLDEARTRATAAVTVGFSGGVVVLEKANGKWTAVRMTGYWIT